MHDDGNGVDDDDDDDRGAQFLVRRDAFNDGKHSRFSHKMCCYAPRSRSCRGRAGALAIPSAASSVRTYICTCERVSGCVERLARDACVRIRHRPAATVPHMCLLKWMFKLENISVPCVHRRCVAARSTGPGDVGAPLIMVVFSLLGGEATKGG